MTDGTKEIGFELLQAFLRIKCCMMGLLGCFGKIRLVVYLTVWRVGRNDDKKRQNHIENKQKATNKKYVVNINLF